MNFVVMTRSDMREAAQDLLEQDLKENILAAYCTTNCLIGLSDPVNYDIVAMDFNMSVWSEHTMSLAVYTMTMIEVCREKFRAKYETSVVPYGNSFWMDMQKLITDLSSDTWKEKLGLPPWTQKDECLKAMRAYMVHKNPYYYNKFPDAGKSIFPIPNPLSIYA